jgi:putative tryptophan/tyrosine transport system substrate-binding protein
MRRIVWFVLISSVLGGVAIGEAQQPTKVPRIGYLSGSGLSVLAARIEAFRQGLRELGYVEGKT